MENQIVELTRTIGWIKENIALFSADLVEASNNQDFHKMNQCMKYLERNKNDLIEKISELEELKGSKVTA